MTKYKKLTRSTFAIVALCLALVGILAFGGTYAYFNATASASDTVTLGTLSLNAGETAIEFDLTSEKVVPGQVLINKDSKLSIAVATNVKMMMLAQITATTTSGTTVVLDFATGSKWESVKNSNDEDTGYFAFKDTNYYTAADIAELDLVTSLAIDRTNGNNTMGSVVTVTVNVWAMQYEYLADTNTETPGGAESAAEVYEAFKAYYSVGNAGTTITLPSLTVGA